MSQKIQVELELKKGKTIDDLGDIADGINEIKSGAKGAEQGVKKFSKSFQAIGKASGIVFLVEKAFELLKETLGKNQKVLDVFNTTFEVLSIAFNDFFKFLDSNIGTVIEYFKGIFENPKQALIDFANAIENNLIERFNSFLDTLGYLASAVKKVFSGDFAGALDDVKSAGKEYVDVLTGVDNSVDKIVETTNKVTKSIVDYTKSTIESAQAVVDLNKQAEVAAVINQGLIEKYDRQAEQQRQIRDDESKTIEERIAANNKLGEVLEEQQKLMLENVDITIKAAQAEYDKNQNQENYIALLEAQNEREAVLAQIEGFRSEQLINRISLEKELSDTVKEGQEAEAERINDLLEKKLEAAKIEADLKKQQVEAAKEQDKQTLNNLIAVVGEGSKVGKAAAVAQATISGIEGVQNAYTTAQSSPITALFPAYPIIQAGLAAAFSGKQIQSILSVDERGGGGSVSAPSGGGSQAPSFNVVGAAPENQLAQAIGEKEDKPMKAYVVSNEVSNAQALDRNIVEGASIG